MPITFHLRSEPKLLERRSPISPAIAKMLLAGYIVNVEHSPGRVYHDEEFAAIGATMVPEGSWVNAPTDDIIVGLKEPPEGNSPPSHTPIRFRRCYENRDGWDAYLSRFTRGNGLLHDIEFLTDFDGQHIAAFGVWPGYVGASIALLAWSHQLLHDPDTPLGVTPSHPSARGIAGVVKTAVGEALLKNTAKRPRIIIIGGNGGCGNGAVGLCTEVGIPSDSILRWDPAETANGEPFPEIASSDIFVNGVYIGSTAILTFTTIDAPS